MPTEHALSYSPLNCQKLSVRPAFSTPEPTFFCQRWKNEGLWENLRTHIANIWLFHSLPLASPSFDRQPIITNCAPEFPRALRQPYQSCAVEKSFGVENALDLMHDDGVPGRFYHHASLPLVSAPFLNFDVGILFNSSSFGTQLQLFAL